MNSNEAWQYYLNDLTIALFRNDFRLLALKQPFNSNTISSLIYLGIFPTAIAFVLRFHIISKAGPVFLSYVAYLIPAFAIFWGYIFLKETITLNTLIGVIFILFGVFIGQQSKLQNN